MGHSVYSSDISADWSARPFTSKRSGSASSEIRLQPALMWPSPPPLSFQLSFLIRAGSF